MLSQTHSALIRSLHLKKYREEKKLFIAEGEKSIRDLLASPLKTQAIYATKNWIQQNPTSPHIEKKIPCHEITDTELKKISALITPNQVLAIIHTPQYTFDINELKNQWTLALDEIKDPGNLGTIIRTAHWFGIHTIICSQDSVELFNPKVIQATMGSFTRVKVHYTNLQEFLQKAPANTPIIGTVLGGENIFKVNLPPSGILLLGNESKGISPTLLPLITQKIMIPSAAQSHGAESLNVSVAAGIVCSILKTK